MTGDGRVWVHGLSRRYLSGVGSLIAELLLRNVCVGGGYTGTELSALSAQFRSEPKPAGGRGEGTCLFLKKVRCIQYGVFPFVKRKL